MAGRPPKPTNIHVIQGTAQKCRMEKRKGELQLPSGMPDAPGFLPAEALVEWGRITSLSRYSAALTQADRSTIAVYCSLWAEFVASQQPGAEPMVSSRLQLFMSIAGKLGMNPSDRVKVRVPEAEKPQNKFAALGS